MKNQSHKSAIHTKSIMVNMTPEMHAGLQALADREERSVSGQVRLIIRHALGETPS